MTEVAKIIAVAAAMSAFVLFLGGMLAASFEHYKDHRDGRPLTFPGWKRRDRAALGRDVDRYALPRWTGWVVWPLVAVGRPELAGRFLAWRASRKRVHA